MDDDKEQPPSSTPDEEPPEPQEVSTTSIEASETVVSGSGAIININKANHQDFLAIFEYAFQKGQQDTATHPLPADSWQKELGETLRTKKRQKVAEDSGIYVPSNKDTKLLETVDDVAEWYEKLPDIRTQCLVQTLAFFHGAQATDIARLTKVLLQEHQPEQQTYLLEQPDNDATSDQNEYAPLDQNVRRLSDRELYQQAHIEKRRVNGVLCLFWKDLDNASQQRRTMLILRYLAEEMMHLSQPDLVDTLKEWIASESEDCAWRAAWTLGVVLFWRSSTQELYQLADIWANSTYQEDRHNAALLLSGAYNAERMEDEKKAIDPDKSDILCLLNRWVGRSQTGDWRVGCAAAETYSLLDQHNPDIALDGLEKLLRLPGSSASISQKNIPRKLLTTCIYTYVGMAWSNHIRSALERLAQHARALAYQEQRPASIDDDLRYQIQRESHLDAIVTIFFLVAFLSFEGNHNNEACYSLTEPLPAQPAFPDEQGRDILLAGLLSTSEEKWREDIVTLLCTAFFVQEADPKEQALYIMRQWIEAIENRAQDDNTIQPIQAAYHRFIIALYTIIKVWEEDAQKIGPGSLRASTTFKYYLTSWLGVADWNGVENSTFIRTFMQKVLAQLEG